MADSKFITNLKADFVINYFFQRKDICVKFDLRAKLALLTGSLQKRRVPTEMMGGYIARKLPLIKYFA